MSLAVASVTPQTASYSTPLTSSSPASLSDAELLAAAFLSGVGTEAIGFARKRAVELAAANNRHAAEFWRRVLAQMERQLNGDSWRNCSIGDGQGSSPAGQRGGLLVLPSDLEGGTRALGEGHWQPSP